MWLCFAYPKRGTPTESSGLVFAFPFFAPPPPPPAAFFAAAGFFLAIVDKRPL